MSAALDCNCPCPTPNVTEVPGTGGADGTGENGVNAFAYVTTGNTFAALGEQKGFTLTDSSWMSVGQVVFIENGGYCEVISVSANGVCVLELIDGYPGNTAPVVIAGGDVNKVSPAGQAFIISPALPAAITDNSTGTASNTVAAGVGITTLTIPLTSLATGLSTSAIDLLTSYVPGYRFKILSFDFVTTVVGAGAGASQVFNLEIGTTNLTGGVLTVTLASTATIGAITSGTAVTANNVGTNTDAISLEMAAGGTVFSSGAGYFLIKIQNMDTADAAATLSDKINDILTSLS